MPRRKADVFTRLTRSHLEAIGRVAAQWSQLEWNMIVAISEVSDLPIERAIAMVGPAAFASWTDTLLILVEASPAHKSKAPELSKLFRLLQRLLTLRNYIVHATWLRPKGQGQGIIAQAMNAPR